MINEPRLRRLVPFALLIYLTLLAGCASTTFVPKNADNTVTTVLLVRHAEKAANQGRDPNLSAAGEQRAAQLATMLADTAPDAIFATEYLRTQQTVAPLARRTGIPVTQVEASDVDGLAKRILEDHRGDTVIVAAHSNTVPAIIEALGSEPVPEIPESEYSNLYVVSLPALGEGSTTRLHFPGQ